GSNFPGRPCPSESDAIRSAVRTLALNRHVIEVTGPTRLFRRTRRYGTRFARLLRTIATAKEWHLDATIDDRGAERELALDQGDLSVPNAEPVVEVSYDSGVEADFAARFEALDLEWELRREPEPLETGSRVMIPDFAFDWPHAVPEAVGEAEADPGPASDNHTDQGFRLFFEIIGFWTPEYVTKKLGQLGQLENVDMIVAVDESLGVGEDIEARDARAIPYSGTVDLKAVRDALRGYEADLIAASADALSAELVPEADAVGLDTLARKHGVSERAFDDVQFSEHERVGRTLVRPAVLDGLAETLAPGMDLADAEAHLEEYGLDNASAILSALGYRVEWEGLSGGVLREKD
ncbi:hypothetical protein BRC86_06065, partial [Halobacteriales archaeon QS_3_64_16]